MRLAPLLLIEHSWHTSAISIIKKPSTNSSPQITGYHHNAKEFFLLQAAENYTPTNIQFAIPVRPGSVVCEPILLDRGPYFNILI
jgi:hypothetical protein